jgi:FkbM family methyltransferase
MHDVLTVRRDSTLRSSLKRILNPSRLATWSSGSNHNPVDVVFRSRNRMMTASVPANELWTAVKDVLVYEDYELEKGFRLSSLPRGARVIDAGAFVGLFSLKASSYAARVVSLEPSNSNYRLLVGNLERNSVSNVMPIKVALSSRKGLTHFLDAGTSSSLTSEGRAGSYEVETTSISDLIDEIGSVDLMKVDIEGAEFEAILATDKSHLSEIDRIVAELHFPSRLDFGRLGDLIDHLRAANMNVSTTRAHVRGISYGLTKPWKSSLEAFDTRSTFAYKLLLSGIYGASPVTRRLKSVYDVGDAAMLFATRV